jgi:hypothetical protein
MAHLLYNLAPDKTGTHTKATGSRRSSSTQRLSYVLPASVLDNYRKSKEEAPTYNATTDDALARPAASGWPCRYYIRTKESIRNVISCELFTQYSSPATENSQSEPSFLNRNLSVVFTVHRKIQS